MRFCELLCKYSVIIGKSSRFLGYLGKVFLVDKKQNRED